ncbi:MAG: SpoIIE family protein phosphatase [Phycisphaerae bacterium]|nr:SpoIIE family protein phosphatase [Phycisphaerae bacterium]
MISILRNRGIAFKLVFFILSSCVIIFASIFSYNYSISRGLLIGKIEDVAQNLTSGAAGKIEATLLPIEKIPEQLAYILEESSFTEDELKGLLHSIVEGNPNIYGGAIAFEPYAFNKDYAYFSPYYYRKNGKVQFVDLGTDEYAYPKWDWYKIPKKLNRPVWIDPYFDKGGGGILMATYSVPFYRTSQGRKEFIGVVTVDVSLSWLEEFVSSIKVGETGYGFLISNKGTLITHPDKDLVMNKTLEEVARTRNNPELLKVGGQMLQGEAGFVPVKNTVTKKETWIAFAPVPTTRWSLGVIFPKDELMAPLHALNRAVVLIGLVGLFFLSLVIILLSNSITRPLRILALKTRDLAGGNLDFELPSTRSRDEAGSLTESFRYMKNSLKKYIEELTKITSEKERIESELKIARRIQMGILPKIAPPFTEGKEFKIYAAMKPAREVGGDLYDFYFLDDKHLSFVIGDVSGKGVPAALFMVMAMTFIKSTAKIIKEPEEILSQVNKALMHDNASCMFVTVFFGILNIETGQIYYSNAGHNMPLVLRKGKDPEFLESDTGCALGAFEGVTFKKGKLDLAPGEALYMYTDGVTEAMNRDNEEFSEESLKEKLRSHKDDSIKKMVEGTFRGIESFSQGTPQSDDITVLVLRYLGRSEEASVTSGKTEEYRIKNDISDIRKLADFVEMFGKKTGLSGDLINDINLSLEEIIHNTIAYGYEDNSVHSIDVRISLEGKELILKVVDDAVAFNPLEAPKPNVDKPIEERIEGGLGIFLVCNIMDKMEYKRKKDKNILLLKKTI